MNEAELSPQVSCVSAFLRPRLKENRSPVSGRVPVRKHLADPLPVAMPPVVGQPLLVTGPFREVRVLEEQLSRPETAIPPTVPVSWVLPSVAKLLGHLLLAHPSSPSHSFPCIGQCVCYSRRSPSLKKLDTSAPLRPQRYYGIKRLVLGASTKWAIIGHRLRVANFGELHKGEVQRIHLLGPRVNKGTRKAGCIRARPRKSGREGTR
jgi:hypothetical protein